MSFQQSVVPGIQYAVGYRDDGDTPVKDGGHLSFPPIAAGGMGTTRSLGKLLAELAFAYKNNCSVTYRCSCLDWEYDWRI